MKQNLRNLDNHINLFGKGKKKKRKENLQYSLQPRSHSPHKLQGNQRPEKRGEEEKMTRGKQKIEAQRRNAEKNQKPKGSQLDARAEGLKVICPICKVITILITIFSTSILLSFI